MIRPIILVLLAAASQAFGADVIPAARRITWTPGVTVGVPGGIPTISLPLINVTEAPYNADNTGTNDAYAAINAASEVARLAPETWGGIYLPSGTYKLVAGPIFGYNDQIIRGAGKDVTFLRPVGNNLAVTLSGYAPSPFQFPGTGISGSPAKGATSITVIDANNYTDYIGGTINIRLKNDRALPVISVSGYEYVRELMVKIDSIPDNNTFIISPPLAFDLPASLEPVWYVANSTSGEEEYSTLKSAGLEDLTVDGTDCTTTVLIGFNRAYASWIKNVKAIHTKNYHLSISHVLQCEVRHSDFWIRDGSGTSGGGILTSRMCNSIIEDNTFDQIFPSIETNFGSTGNVFTYNFVNNSDDSGVIGASFLTHGPHNSYNYYEGNVIPRSESDGYFGSESEVTLFRNWFHGTSEETTTNQLPGVFNRFSRNFNIVGNLFGRTGRGITWTYNTTGPNFDTTSTTPISVSVDAHEMIVGTGLQANSSGGVYIAYSAADPTNKYMAGRVSFYDVGTGELFFITSVSKGSGTVSDWVFKGGTGYGNSVTLAFGHPNIGGGGFFGNRLAAAPNSIGASWRCWPDRIAYNRLGGTSGQAYNPATVYTTGDLIAYNPDDAPYGQPYLTEGVGGARISTWMAYNVAKNGTATWDEPGTTSVDWLPWSAGSFQELDYDAYSTAIVKGNWNAFTLGVPSNEALGGDTYPNSYVYETKPANFGILAWPPVSATAPPSSQGDQADLAIIPAAYRYINGIDPPLSGTIATTTTLNVGSINKIP